MDKPFGFPKLRSIDHSLVLCTCTQYDHWHIGQCYTTGRFDYRPIVTAGTNLEIFVDKRVAGKTKM